jgi:hypothetical protein
MAVLGMILMWVVFAVFLQVLGQWNSGKESDRRQTYWAKYEDK